MNSAHNANMPFQLAVIRQRYTPYGGAERFVSLALTALADRGVALSLYTRQWPEGESVFRPVICNPFYLGSLWRDWSFGHSVCKAIERDKPTLVQSHERISCCDIFRAGDGVHRVWLEQRRRHMSWWDKARITLNPAHHFRLAAERRLFASPRLKAVICISEMVKSEVLQHFRIAPEKLYVIYNAVDADRFSPALAIHRGEIRRRYGIPESAILFLLLGSGYDRKGVGPAIEAIAQLPPHAHLLVVGKDKHASRYQAQAQRLGSNRVHFAGPQADPRPFYGAADVFVLPTLYDPLSNAVLEALSCGLPVITSHKCGAGEIVAASNAGFLNDARDIQALSQNMIRLLDADTRRMCSINARRAAQVLTATEMSGRLLALYDRLLNPDAGISNSTPGFICGQSA